MDDRSSIEIWASLKVCYHSVDKILPLLRSLAYADVCRGVMGKRQSKGVSRMNGHCLSRQVGRCFNLPEM